ncbi:MULTISPECIES: type-F conjugative transfer system mating-pair stabilization protein TraN [unclassified Pantoea]|uniref:type-F conjugative transfer system mating-pair stabilization protein TraN n=1 Tax=unclassified Pantoea TaxID=2630326 RepID=UPI002477C2C8|nr:MULTISPECIES: type-F conjugative transfer system mating-pair stabilization protein TraN [unclassified Pantoea]GME47606.1 type-F conjugative transfer system mating-pair stabilization protein TraN [Pantoea sp. QMID3]GME47789.1 type-F conjugative transfer system mating-pair stabilization protein TraN [Pantoea sp. QMID1]GME62626.1 type-F conjugative transfer system mating-pair stabilization protein TraN [Pantoea sp. QMID4]GME63775.1 type-F conjugative transfer system mating-pair stabilization pr
MKCAVLLSLCLIASGAFADATSDAYNAGAGYAGSNKGQGTAAAKGTDPASVIPGYTASPPQGGYYGGVQGGDGGIKDKGQTQIGSNEAGQAVTDSSTKNPPVTIDPNADFIQNGKNAEANSGSIVDGTNSQCTAKVVSKSVFENFTCDRDVAQVQTCARTGSIILTGSSHTETRTMNMLLKNARRVDKQVLVDITFPETATLVSGTTQLVYTPAPTYVTSPRFYYYVALLNNNVTLEYGKGAVGINIAGVQVNAGQTYTAIVTMNSSRGNTPYDTLVKYINNGTTLFHLDVTYNVTVSDKKADTTWSESCSFDKSQATASTGTVCTDPGGTRSVDSDGQTYTQTQGCWQYQDSYIVPVNSTGNCAQLMSDRNCTLAGRGCTEAEGGTCTHEQDTYQCQTTFSSQGLLCGGQYLCQSGDCDGTDGAGDNGFDTAVAKLAGLASAGDDVKNGDQINIKAFTGQALYCRKAMAGFSNCCVDTGWGNSSGLANCNSDEMAIGKAKAKKVTVLVGEACNKAVLGVCVQKKQAYCVFGGKLARIIQEQGRRDQLHVSFGSGDSPNCRGITVPELQAINFDLINFQDFYSDLMANQKIPDSATMIKQAKDRIAAQVNAQTGGK